jgi:hypothetical protein
METILPSVMLFDRCSGLEGIYEKGKMNASRRHHRALDLRGKALAGLAWQATCSKEHILTRMLLVVRH